MKKFLSLLLAVMLCCAVFVSCGKAEQEPEASPEPSVEAEASPSPTPEPRTEVGIPEELKFCEEPLYYGMTIEEIREIFGQEDETSESEHRLGSVAAGYNRVGTHKFYIYNDAQCQGKRVALLFRIFNYDGLIYQKSYGLDGVFIRWLDISDYEQQTQFLNEEIRPIIENLYGAPDYEYEKPVFRMVWDYHPGENSPIAIGKSADCPQIEFESVRAQLWDSIGLKDEAAAYKESGKQGLTLENLNRLKEGMSYDQAEMLLGPSTEEVDRYTAGGVTYITYAWENDLGAYLKITFCDGEIDSIYSSGVR